MKDFCDLWIMARAFAYESETLTDTIRRTFERHRTPFPDKNLSASAMAFAFVGMPVAGLHGAGAARSGTRFTRRHRKPEKPPAACAGLIRARNIGDCPQAAAACEPLDRRACP